MVLRCGSSMRDEVRIFRSIVLALLTRPCLLIAALSLSAASLGCAHIPSGSRGVVEKVMVEVSAVDSRHLKVVVRNDGRQTVSIGQEPFVTTNIVPYTDGRALEIVEFGTLPLLETPYVVLASGASVESRPIRLPTVSETSSDPDSWCFHAFPVIDGEVFEVRACLPVRALK